MTTLQPLLRRSFAKQSVIPEPAPVRMAVLDSTFIAILTDAQMTKEATLGKLHANSARGYTKEHCENVCKTL